MEVTSASDLKLDYLKLLVTQLQTQNPLEPMSNDEMTAQMATLSQLEQTEELNSNMKALNSKFEGAMLIANYDYANSFLDKNVSFFDPNYDQAMTGSVKKITIIDKDPILEVHVNTGEGSTGMTKFNVPLENVMQVQSNDNFLF